VFCRFEVFCGQKLHMSRKSHIAYQLVRVLATVLARSPWIKPEES
jgi:hypothetical protein